VLAARSRLQAERSYRSVAPDVGEFAIEPCSPGSPATTSGTRLLFGVGSVLVVSDPCGSSRMSTRAVNRGADLSL